MSNYTESYLEDYGRDIQVDASPAVPTHAATRAGMRRDSTDARERTSAERAAVS